MWVHGRGSSFPAATGGGRRSTFALVGATGKGNVRRRRDGDGTRGVRAQASARLGAVDGRRRSAIIDRPASRTRSSGISRFSAIDFEVGLAQRKLSNRSCVQRAQSNDRAWSTRVVRDRSVTNLRVGALGASFDLRNNAADSSPRRGDRSPSGTGWPRRGAGRHPSPPSRPRTRGGGGRVGTRRRAGSWSWWAGPARCSRRAGCLRHSLLIRQPICVRAATRTMPARLGECA